MAVEFTEFSDPSLAWAAGQLVEAVDDHMTSKELSLSLVENADLDAYRFFRSGKIDHEGKIRISMGDEEDESATNNVVLVYSGLSLIDCKVADLTDKGVVSVVIGYSSVEVSVTPIEFESYEDDADEEDNYETDNYEESISLSKEDKEFLGADDDDEDSD